MFTSQHTSFGKAGNLNVRNSQHIGERSLTYNFYQQVTSQVKFPYTRARHASNNFTNYCMSGRDHTVPYCMTVLNLCGLSISSLTGSHMLQATCSHTTLFFVKMGIPEIHYCKALTHHCSGLLQALSLVHLGQSNYWCAPVLYVSSSYRKCSSISLLKCEFSLLDFILSLFVFSVCLSVCIYAAACLGQVSLEKNIINLNGLSWLIYNNKINK